MLLEIGLFNTRTEIKIASNLGCPNSYFYNNNNGNFICVFKCTVVNLTTCRQFTNAA